MIRKAIGLTIMLALAGAAPLFALSQNGQSLGSVNLPRAVMANGERLAAGTYTVRTSSRAVTTPVGQAPEAVTWVEFVQDGQVRGRELATVLTGEEAISAVVESGAPASGASKVEMLRGNEYLRVWINQGGTHYLIHLAVSVP